MKGKRKQKIREEKEREQRIGLAVTVAILIAVISFSGFLINSMLNQPSTNHTVSSISEPKAAIVDQASLSPAETPNPQFTETATNLLKQTWDIVDYYHGERVNVDFYRNLATHGYALIILRVHSGLSKGGNPPVGFFTSEPYSSQKYLYEQLTEQIVSVHYLPYEKGDPEYFGIWPGFITQSMQGRFNNTIIIMMGCDGLRYTDMAEAFLQKGAKVYMSWNRSVSPSHSDTATIRLLQHLITEKQTVKQSVENTMNEVGPDYSYKSYLIYHPSESGDYTIQSIVGTMTTNIGETLVAQDILRKRMHYRVH